jgi:Fe-S oxidoreductase
MRASANRCARVGACRKTSDSGGTMCPSFMATREEEHSTRGRANALVRALSQPQPDAALADPRLHEVLDLCLECKACRTECPMSVDMATLKSEALAHRWAREGVPLRARVFGAARTMNRIGAAFAPVSNWLTSLPGARTLTERVLGIDRRRPLPRFANLTLQRWFAKRAPQTRAAAKGRGPVVLLADSFTSFTEPEIGRAAVDLLERAGWDVTLAGDVCCGRALISKGLLDRAKDRQRALIERLAPFARKGIPIVGCEPSCVAALREELPALSGGVDAAAVAARATMVDTLLLEAFDDGALVPLQPAAPRHIVFHAHCHQKAAGLAPATAALLRRLTDTTVDVLDAGCCGMAGSFGFETEHYDLSMSIGAMRLFPAVREAAAETIIAATGVSCRQQIAQGTQRSALHPLLIVSEAVGGTACR